MGWASAWLAWYLLLLLLSVVANVTETSPCNALHAFPVVTAAAMWGGLVLLTTVVLAVHVGCWHPAIKSEPTLKHWLGGFGYLHAAFMLAWCVA